MTQSYCGPTVAADDNGTVYAFAASGCSSDSSGGFAESAVLGYHLASGTTTVHKVVSFSHHSVIHIFAVRDVACAVRSLCVCECAAQ